MTKHRQPFIHWLLLAGILALVSLACGLGTAKESEIDPAMETKTDGMEMVYVPAGEFLMGSTDADGEADDDEKPQHRINLDAYWIGWTEVTNAMFAKFVEAEGYETDAEKEGWGFAFEDESWGKVKGADWQHPLGNGSSIDGMQDHPVVQVSWNDASAYCEWAGMRLPSEAEWEKAARGTDGRIYPWGKKLPSEKLLNFADGNLKVNWSDRRENDGYEFTAPVGNYEAGASPYGALDMAGNIWEWVNDWYDKEYYQQSPAGNPQGPASGEKRVARGGSWYESDYYMRSAYRQSTAPDYRSAHTGFRCVLSEASQEE